jgi:predicted nucleic acid-binding Zn ribbon protein
MPRKLRIVKLTPIAIAVCESCGREFHSRLSLEDDALKEMEDLYAAHLCEAKNVVKGE